MKTASETAYAKINLFLAVGEKRADGYHELLTFMRLISLADTLTVSMEKSDKTDITLSVSGNDAVPSGADNLVCRAVSAYLRETNEAAKVVMRLEKHIPIQAGLGGGSSDAAAALRAVNRLSENRLSEARLCVLAAEIGSDVPFFISQNAALCSGRGEKLQPISVSDAPFVVVVEGREKSDTAAAYRALDKWKENRLNAASLPVSSLSDNTPPLDFLRFSYTQIRNDFEAPVSLLCSSVTEHLFLLRKYGAFAASMSGSGSSVFGLFSDEKTASYAAFLIGDRAHLCHLFADKQ